MFYDKITLITTTPFLNQGVYSRSFVAAFPTDRADAGPSTGSLPTDPFLVERARSSIATRSTRCSRRDRSAATPASSTSTTPTAACRRLHQVTLGYERQLGAQMAADGRLRAQLEPRTSSIDFDLNPGDARQHHRAPAPSPTPICEGLAGAAGDQPVRQPGDDARQRRQLAVRRRELLAREALQRPAGRRACRTRSATRAATRGQPDRTSTTTRCSAIRIWICNFGPLDNDRQAEPGDERPRSKSRTPAGSTSAACIGG